MKEHQWIMLKNAAAMQTLERTPISLIVDSPWIPGYLGISTIDYLTNPQVWLDANLEIERRFPEVIFMPGFWSEMGMAAEPSGFGCKVSFYDEKTPLVYPLTSDLEIAAGLSVPNPRADGLMPIILNYYKWAQPRAKDAGHMIKIAAARGPLAIATHLTGVTEFLLGVKLDPENTHKFLQVTTQICRQWLEAQAEVLPDVEGILLLDDIVGFLSPQDFQEFAFPYLKEVLDSFPEALKIFHNDMDNPVSFEHLWKLPTHIFNFTHHHNADEVRELVGPQVCLMGNIAPLDTLCNESPDVVLKQALGCIKTHPEKRGLILSAGGGVSPGTPEENIRALIQAVYSD